MAKCTRYNKLLFWQAILFNNMFSLFQVKVYLIFSFIEISHTVRNTDNCLEPDNLIELARKLARDNLNFHNSYYMLAPLRSAWEKKDREYHLALSRYKTPFNMKIHGRRECPKHLQASVKEMVSTCPVFWELNHDIARVPRTIVQAQCMCKQCLVRKDEDYLKARMPDYECRPVYFYERVLRRVDCDNNNVYIYRTVIEKIKVGCTCAIPIKNP